MAINFGGNPRNGRGLKQKVDGIDEIKAVFTRFRNEARLADSDGSIIVTCNNTLASCDVVGAGQCLTNEQDCIQTCQLASVGVTLFEGTWDTVDTSNIGLAVWSGDKKS